MKPLRWLELCLCCLVSALVLTSGVVHADETGDGREYPIEGILYFGNRDCTDNQVGPCDAYFELEGEAARQLYNSMRTTPVADLCTEGLMKSDTTGLHCYLTGSGEYGCHFGYDLLRHRIVEGDFTC